MDLYVVAKGAQEESNTGVVEQAFAVVYGVYTTRRRASEMADKYGAAVFRFMADSESEVVVAKWLNPGYVSSST